MIKLLMLAILISFANCSYCIGWGDTTKLKNSVNYFFYVQTGILIKISNDGGIPNVAASTVHGIRFQENKRIGLGVGFNHYGSIKTMPLFVSYSQDLLGKENKLFLEMNYGGSIAKTTIDSKWDFSADSGPMMNPSIGYSGETNGIRVSLIVGYVFQRLNSQYSESSRYGTISLQPASYIDSRLQIDLNRAVFAIRIGWR